ncbi:MAG: ABC transporter ATP-binding protein [Lachnospiraceae bacterium]|nr:ABC transporter ATP-binding protein [Lachnospiraceae bacterium]
MEPEELLRIAHLSVAFEQYQGGMEKRDLQVIRDLSVNIRRGEITAVVGASGSGKSLLAHAVLGILPYNASQGGSIYYRGQELNRERAARLRGREIVLVPQSIGFLDPLMKIGPQIRKGKKDKASRERVDQILKSYSLKPEVGELYPFELSGGMNRRVLVSTALMEAPGLVIADEPTPGLEMKLARRVMEHFRELAEQGAGVLLITHDLELAIETADWIVVFYAGTTLEEARAQDFREEELLRHPYSRALWRAMPQNGFTAIPGTQPYAAHMPQGCPFGPRCDQCTEECLQPVPWREIRGGRVRCVHAKE